LRGGGGEPVDFARTIVSHGVAELPPNVVAPDGSSLETVLAARGRAWVVVLSAVRRARGLSDGAVDAAARPLTTRLGLASALRGLAEGRWETVLHGQDGQVTRAVLGRVGRDFVEARTPDGSLEVVPFTAIAALSSG